MFSPSHNIAGSSVKEKEIELNFWVWQEMVGPVTAVFKRVYFKCKCDPIHFRGAVSDLVLSVLRYKHMQPAKDKELMSIAQPMGGA